jgi:hypothetical protein
MLGRPQWKQRPAGYFPGNLVVKIGREMKLKAYNEDGTAKSQLKPWARNVASLPQFWSLH